MLSIVYLRSCLRPIPENGVVILPGRYRNRSLDVILVVIGISYPFLVYAGLSVLPGNFVVLLVLVYAGIRFGITEADALSHASRYAIGGAGLTVAFLYFFDAELAIRSYSVAVSLIFALLFITSLYQPVSAIERIARMTNPVLSARGVAYTRSVTKVWICFFIINGAIAAYTAFLGSRELWAAYNGLVSYILVAALILGERVIRKRMVIQ